jgi:lysophosphatidate acyltransferase
MIDKSKEHLFRIRNTRTFRLKILVFSFFVVFITKPLFFLFYGLRVSGRKNLKKAKKGIIIANHSMSLDAFFVGTTCWPRTTWYAVESNNILRKEVGWFNRMNGAFGIHDGYPMSIATSVREAMTGNQYVTIFPEGWQKYRNQNVMPFNKGAFYLALENGVPVFPIAIVLYGRRFLRNSPWITPRVRLHILPPIETEGLLQEGDSIRKKSAELAEKTRKLIQDRIDSEGGHKDLVIEPLFK